MRDGHDMGVCCLGRCDAAQPAGQRTTTGEQGNRLEQRTRERSAQTGRHDDEETTKRQEDRRRAQQDRTGQDGTIRRRRKRRTGEDDGAEAAAVYARDEGVGGGCA